MGWASALAIQQQKKHPYTSRMWMAYLRVGSGYKTRVEQDMFVVPDRVSFEVGDRAARLFKNAVRCAWHCPQQ
jgi:hypothetical protein